MRISEDYDTLLKGIRDDGTTTLEEKVEMLESIHRTYHAASSLEQQAARWMTGASLVRDEESVLTDGYDANDALRKDFEQTIRESDDFHRRRFRDKDIDTKSKEYLLAIQEARKNIR